MTTNADIRTHSWPVKVTAIDQTADGEKRTETIVPPNNVQTHYMTQTRKLLLEEMPLPGQEPAAKAAPEADNADAADEEVDEEAGD